MPFRFRRSKKIGPFRFTLSNSGLSGSVGGGGLRYQFLGGSRKRRIKAVPVTTFSPAKPGQTLAGLCLLGIGAVVGLTLSTGSHNSRDERPTSTTIPVSVESRPVALTETPAQEAPAATIPVVVQKKEPIHVVPIEHVETQGESRFWVDITGKYTTRARLLEVRGNSAYLQKENGKIAAIPTDKLCPTDRDYVGSLHTDQVLTGRVTGVQEGDTITVRADGLYRVHLDEIDAPEKQQDSFAKSQEALASKVLDKQIEIEWKEKRDDGVILGSVIFDNRWINKELIDEGWAWNHSDSQVLAESEAKARDAKLGIWADDSASPPWEFQPPPPPRTIVKSEPRNVDRPANPKDGPADYGFTSRSSVSNHTSSLAPTPEQDDPDGRPSYGAASNGSTPTGIPTYVGPRGGVYHYSKNGNKVYSKHK